jgi:hypothetical protein
MPGETYHTIKKYDEALNPGSSENYSLYIQIAASALTFCIFDQYLNKYLSIESFPFPDLSLRNADRSVSEKKISDHSLLNRKFKTVSIIYEINQSTLVPEPLFDSNELVALSNFNFTVAENLELKYEKLKNLDAYIIYPLPESVIKLVDQYFVNHRFRPHLSVLIESLLIKHKNLPNQKRIFVNVRTSFIDIIITEGKQLIYANTFNFRTKEDFVYYIIFVLEQLNLNPENTDLTLAGEIDKKSELFELLYKYVRNVDFATLPQTVKYSYVFNEFPAHHFYTLLNIRFCE